MRLRSGVGSLGLLVGGAMLVAAALDRPRPLRAARSAPVRFAAYLTTTPLPPLDPTPHGEAIVPGPPQPTPERAGDAITTGRVAGLREARILESPTGSSERVLGFTPAGDRLVSVLGADLVIRSLPDGQQIDRIADVMPRTSGYGRVRIAPDGQIIAIAGESGPGDVELWSLDLGRRLRQHRGGNLVTQLAFAPDGRALLAARGDGPVHQWDLASGRLVADFGLSRTWDAAVMAVHPSLARVALGRGGDTLVRLVDLESGATLENRHLSGRFIRIRMDSSPAGPSSWTAAPACPRIGPGSSPIGPNPGSRPTDRVCC